MQFLNTKKGILEQPSEPISFLQLLEYIDVMLSQHHHNINSE